MRSRFAPARVIATSLPDGGLQLDSPASLLPHARAVGDWLEAHAAATPDRPFLVERERVSRLAQGSDAWRAWSYAEALAEVRRLAAGLLALGLDGTRPLLLLSDNSVEHALLQLGAMHAGIAAAPVSPAYSLRSRDFVKLRSIAAQLGPGAVYVSDGAAFAPALAALALDVPLLVGVHPPRGAIVVAALEGDADAVARAFAAVGPDTVAKILFTSGSTGSPRGVVNTQRMLTSNQQAIRQCWPFLDERPPVVVDWLPFSHTFGGNHNFNLVLAGGGTLHVSDGKAAPGLVERTVAALREVSPTIYFDVPRGFDLLLPFLEGDGALRERFFAELELLFYAAAPLPNHLWERLEKVAALAGNSRVSMVSAWGSTETAPMATTVHFAIARAGVIGLPPPGTSIRLTPTEGKLELRVRGPGVTPGWWLPGGGVSPIVLDDNGYLRTGDAGRLADATHPEAGLVFDGRIAENFKLGSGTWVPVGEVRTGAVSALAPLVEDAVVTGHDRDALGLLLFPSLAGLRAVAGEDAELSTLVDHPRVRERLRSALATYNAGRPQSSLRVTRALFLLEPPSTDAGEITDKGYLNQRAVLSRRAALVEKLHAEPCPPDVLAC